MAVVDDGRSARQFASSASQEGLSTASFFLFRFVCVAPVAKSVRCNCGFTMKSKPTRRIPRECVGADRSDQSAEGTGRERRCHQPHRIDGQTHSIGNNTRELDIKKRERKKCAKGKSGCKWLVTARSQWKRCAGCTEFIPAAPLRFYFSFPLSATPFFLFVV